MLTHFAFPFKCNVNVNANRKKGGNVCAKFVGGGAKGWVFGVALKTFELL